MGLQLPTRVVDFSLWVSSRMNQAHVMGEGPRLRPGPRPQGLVPLPPRKWTVVCRATGVVYLATYGPWAWNVAGTGAPACRWPSLATQVSWATAHF